MFLCAMVLRVIRMFKGESADSEPELAPGATHKAAITEMLAEDEKSGLMVDEEALPQYEPRN